MEAVLMAAGKGVRLLPLTANRPKPMISFLNRPLIEYVFNTLREATVDKITILVDYYGEKIMDYFGDGNRYGVKIEYSGNNIPFGTAGAVKKVAKKIDDTFIVGSADVLTKINLRDFVKFHKMKGGLASIALSTADDPTQYGIVVKDEDDRIVRFLEKPKTKEEAFSNLINAGIYVVEPEIFDKVPPNTDFDFSKNLFPLLLKEDVPIYGFQFSEYWNDIGRPSTYLGAVRDYLMMQNKTLSVTKEGEGILITGESCKVPSNINVKGFAIIGDNIEIGRNVEIDSSVIWSSTKLGDDVKMINTIVGENALIDSNVVIGAGSVLGDNCIIGKGVKLEQNTKLWYGSRIGSGTQMTSD
jgi:mannose-1-phosphate guanylyltransferase